MYLFLLNPFCALLQILSITLLSLLFRAREIILYKLLRREIGLQFFILVASAFLGISLIQAPLKLSVRLPVSKQCSEYLSRGSLRNFQHFFINGIPKPSTPGADLGLPSSTALSSSVTCRGVSMFSLSWSVSREFCTRSELTISSPRKFSTMLS